MAEHDGSYKLLFSHAEMVADLLRGFVQEEWVADLDFSTLERVEGSYVSDALLSREQDVVWRVQWGDGKLYIYIVIEFQSAVDRWMALRLMTYVGLLYQDLVRNDCLTPRGNLPPVLPIVLYNGERPWTAPVSMADLVDGLGGVLARYRPEMRYLLIEEHRYPAGETAELNNLVAALFRLESSRDPEQLLATARHLVAWLGEPQQASLRRAFTVWFKRVLFPGRFPAAAQPAIEDLKEVPGMLAERIKEWQEQFKIAGLEEGRKVGLEEGRKVGLEEGRKVGLQQGLQQGRIQERQALLLRLLEKRFGAVAAQYRQRIAQANEDELLAYTDRIFQATTIDDVFTAP